MSVRVVKALVILTAASIAGLAQAYRWKPEAKIFDVIDSKVYTHEKVERLLGESYQTNPEREVASILAKARDKDAKIGQFTVRQLMGLNRLGAKFCLADELNGRQSMCKEIGQANVKLYCEYCARKLAKSCELVAVKLLTEAALEGRWRDFDQMLHISTRITNHMISAAAETKPEAELVAEFCHRDDISRDKLHETCSRVYGWLEAQVFAFYQKELVADYLKRANGNIYDVSLALERCRLILDECKPNKWSLEHWLVRTRKSS